MWVKVTSIAGACVLGAGFFIGGTVSTPPSLMRVALADDPVAAPEGRSDSPSVEAKTDGTTPVASRPAPADVAAVALLAGMDPGSLMQNPDGSLVYRGTTPVGVETPGWSTIARDGGLMMVRGPVAPAPAAAGPLQSPTAPPYQAENTVPLPQATAPQPEATVPQPAEMTPQPEATVPLLEAPAVASVVAPGTTPQPAATVPQPHGTVPGPGPETVVPQPEGAVPQPQDRGSVIQSLICEFAGPSLRGCGPSAQE